MYYRNSEWEKCKEYYEKAIEVSDYFKTDAQYFTLGCVYSNLKDYKNEELAFRNCIDLNPSYPDVNNNLGYSLYKQKRYSESLVFYNKSMELDTDKYYPYRNKYESLKKLSRINEAIELTKLYPQHFNTKYYRDDIEKITGMTSNINETYDKLNEITESTFAGSLIVSNSASGIELYPHQQEAIREMNKKILNVDEYAGLLVLPTGGGKTLTATYWLMESLLDKGCKIIWLAHRHELLNQAQKSFEKVCYKDITRNKPSYNWRIISGQHDKPIHIKPTDDIIVGSKTSLKRGLNYLKQNWLKENGDKTFLIIDEAHHAVAQEYRDLINSIKTYSIKFKMLGLTATPFRTTDNEQGLLKKIFPDDIVYKIDLRELINRGILSEPIFKSVATNVNMVDLFEENNSEEALERITKESFFDIESIGKETASAIANNSTRNKAIVDEYIKNKDLYKQTLVFALNVEMAIVLSSLFNKAGMRSDFVVSDIKDMATHINISSDENKIKTQKFRNGELDILVNVNILTEGFDVPNVQSVFLTRPTKSTILMTQMIGRALRGEKAGGTKEAYIVSFIDNWQDKIAWVNPEQLFIDENVDFTKTDYETRKMSMRLVSIAKMEEFAKIANDTIDPKLSDLAFIDRIPVGIYKFSYLVESLDDDELEKSCNILVYDCMKKAYEVFFEWLPTANLTDVNTVADHVDTILFGSLDVLLGYNKNDVADIICYYKQTQETPQMIYLSERKDYDITALAQYIVDNALAPIPKSIYIDTEWSKSDRHWSAFFGIENQRAFRKLIDDAIDRFVKPNDYNKTTIEPLKEKEKIKIQQLPLYEIRRKFPELGEKIRNAVFEKHTNAEGLYYSTQSGYKSRNRLDFQIDHIKPMSEGGLTVLDNLQLLTRVENLKKSNF
ncbi:MAG: DEAD/DEAH box helicase family protein [Eubacteriales bacterium]